MAFWCVLLQNVVINEISLTWKGWWCMIPLECGVLERVNSQETESRRGYQNLGSGKEKWFVPGYRVGDKENNVGDNEKVMGINTGDAYTALWMFLIPLNCTLIND